MEKEIANLQSALSEAALILSCSTFLLEAEHRDPGRWRDMVAILNDLVRERVDQATRITSRLDLVIP